MPHFGQPQTRRRREWPGTTHLNIVGGLRVTAPAADLAVAAALVSAASDRPTDPGMVCSSPSAAATSPGRRCSPASHVARGQPQAAARVQHRQ